MANVYVEARPKHRPEGEPINDYVVEDHADSEDDENPARGDGMGEG